ncbi:hypothetical protein GE115_10860 [Agromyces sp. CFH 90414]|uniref:Uncharacterized protein n=1 Tax=Agromyces agglutinans TaxID=2662258 RepID=A0A6I2F7R9_9MICO|nr:hypothetical protein [Agromyces agglutinans]MRG60361.1 hypothetical protein [Agromyces agglutinans]
MLVIEVVLGVLGVIVLCSIAVTVTVVLVLRAVFRRIRRSRAVGQTALRTRARLSRGPQRTVLALRVRLDETLRSGQAAVELATDGSGPRGELPRLYRRIAEEGRVLDLQLRLMESETDAAALAEELSAGRRRVEEVEHLVRRVRTAVASGLTGTTDDALSALGSDVEREVAALRAGIDELQALNRRDGRVAPPTASTVRDEGNRP